MRKLITVSLLLLGLSAFSLADEWNKTFPVTSKPDFHLITDDANLNIVSSDAKEVRVNVTTRGWKIPDDIKVVEHQDGNHDGGSAHGAQAELLIQPPGTVYSGRHICATRDQPGPPNR